MSPRSAAVSWISQRTAMHEPYAYFEHDADMGIVGRGERIEEAFEQAATAMFAMMADPAQVRPQASVAIEFEEADVELALVTWLNLLLGEARSRGLVFGRFKLRRDGASPKVGDRRSGPPEEVGTFPSGGTEASGAPPKGTSFGARWSGTAEGEPWRDGLERGVEIKGATLTGLAVTQRNGIWDARCVVDV
jgi:SHS2 domain-containing protein